MFWLWFKAKTDMAVSEVVGSWSLLFRQLAINQYQRRFTQPNTPLSLRSPMPIRFSASTRKWERSSRVVPRALDPETDNRNSDTYSQEDLWYVGKLAVGSIAGGAVIKYGSALFPQITTPDIVVALTIIITPVIVAVLLLIKESRPKP